MAKQKKFTVDDKSEITRFDEHFVVENADSIESIPYGTPEAKLVEQELEKRVCSELKKPVVKVQQPEKVPTE